MTATPGRLVDVALPVPLFRTFTYAVPAELEARVRVGARVVAPLRGGKEVGVVVGEGSRLREGVRAKALLDAPDDAPALDEPMVRLCRWIAEYYIAPIGLAVKCALPALLTGAATPAPAPKTQRVVSLAHELPSLLRRDRVFARAPQQRALFELIESLGGRAPVEHLLEHLKFSASVLKGLEARGLVTIEAEVIARDPFARRKKSLAARHTPTAAQQHAIEATATASPGQTVLLRGVTGSGKTLVYLELLRKVVLERGQTAIVLVPEIALTPQTVDRFRAVFGDQVAVLHSALGDGERLDAWLALKRGEKRIAVGARSAIFAPVSNLGAIVVDEEHESSYKQSETPRYHAREVAVMRAHLAGAVCLLGSATPSLESWSNAVARKYALVSLPERVGGATLPTIEVVDRRKGPVSEHGVPAEPLRQAVSDRLELALADRLAKGEQSILLLNRRGYASFIQCGACGDVAVCPNCSISLTYHRSPEKLVCHYCLHEEQPREACKRCGERMLRRRGLGTQQVERLLGERFPGARIARMDVDTTSGKWSHVEILDRVAKGDVDILLGTQMIAKGLDFPNVTLVGVIDADVGINLPDFRASERCFQLLSQVAGRAGRGAKGGHVYIQTRAPEHHAVRCAMAQDYDAFVRSEITGRESPSYPPTVRLANIVFSGEDEALTARFAIRGGAWLHSLLRRRNVRGMFMVGPAPCPVQRIKNRWRWHLLLKADGVGELTRVAQYFAEKFPVPRQGRMRVSIDRDPVSLL